MLARMSKLQLAPHAILQAPYKYATLLDASNLVSTCCWQRQLPSVPHGWPLPPLLGSLFGPDPESSHAGPSCYVQSVFAKLLTNVAAVAIRIAPVEAHDGSRIEDTPAFAG